MREHASGIVTLLFTDLVGSTELLSRAGDEAAKRIFRAHHGVLAEAAATHGGAEVKWLGDGLMAAFSSAADALRCAIAMQQASRRPVAGERLTIRVGLNAGEAFKEEADYFGTPVVVARRLCDRASGGQILCSELVAGLVAGRASFNFRSLGALELKGVPQPVAAVEAVYEAEAPLGLLAHLPFVGRDTEVARLLRMLEHATAGQGGLVFVVGEPGIGKTRLVEELADAARRDGVCVLWGHCLDGDWAPPYAPFVEVVEGLVDEGDPEDLRADLGTGGPTLSQLVPALRERLPDLRDAAPVQPDEERFRLLEAMAELLAARSRRGPVLVCLEDLHWADRSTVAMLRHVARSAPKHSLLVVGTYRDTEVRIDHPLHDAVGALRREVEFERLRLEGLEAKAVGELLEVLTNYDVVGSVAAAIAVETDGNPFFITEVLRHLVEEGRFGRGGDGRWTSDRPVMDLGIPDGVRDVIDRRLARLSADANKLLSAASVFEGDIRLDVVATMIGLDEDSALDALDEGLDAQLLRPAAGGDSYAFTHALVRHTLIAGLSPSRRARLHLWAADALAAVSEAEPSPARSGEIASQYRRAAGLPGTERGVEPALAAATHAEATGAHDEAARFLRIALELVPQRDSRRPHLLGRLGVALIWALAFDEAVLVATEAADAIAAAEEPAAAADYLSEAAYACVMAGSNPHAWELARQGLRYAGNRRDVAWALLVSLDSERRTAEEAEHPGIPFDTPERRESARILRAARLDPYGPAPMEAVFSSREEAAESSNLSLRGTWLGEVERSLPLLEADFEVAVVENRFARALRGATRLGACYAGLGRLEDAREMMQRAEVLTARMGRPMFMGPEARAVLCGVLDEGWEEAKELFWPLAESPPPATMWALGYIRAASMRIAAHLDDRAAALRFLDLLIPWLEQAPMWTMYYPAMACYPAEALWLLESLDHVEVVERAVRTNVVEPDFRSPWVDGRLSLGRLCALTGRHDEAVSWFAEARPVVAEMGAFPMLALTDFDEALMYLRRDGSGDLDRARALLDAARRQFEAIGMTGWIRRADELNKRFGLSLGGGASAGTR